MDDCNNDNNCLLHCFQKCINLTLQYSHLIIRVQVQYGLDVTRSRVSNLLTLLSHLLELIWGYSWQVFYYPRATHARLLDDLRELFLTWLCMLTVIDHHNVLRLVLRLVSRSRNLRHRVLIHWQVIFRRSWVEIFQGYLDGYSVFNRLSYTSTNIRKQLDLEIFWPHFCKKRNTQSYLDGI